MPSVNSRLFKATGVAASLLALFFMLGGHWFALQSVAWARMFAAFARTDSLSEASRKHSMASIPATCAWASARPGSRSNGNNTNCP